MPLVVLVSGERARRRRSSIVRYDRRMRVERRSETEVTLTLTLAELRTVNNALNEALEALAPDPDELATRMGATAEEVEALLREVHRVVE
jgi:hypothetical protein